MPLRCRSGLTPVLAHAATARTATTEPRKGTAAPVEEKYLLSLKYISLNAREEAS